MLLNTITSLTSQLFKLLLFSLLFSEKYWIRSRGSIGEINRELEFTKKVINYCIWDQMVRSQDRGIWVVLGFMVFNATFNNISVISWRSVLLVEETRVPGESHRPVGSHWQTLSHNVVSSTPQLRWIRTHVSGDRHWYYIGSMDMNPETNLRNPECMFRTCTSVIILASFLFLIYQIDAFILDNY